MSFHRDSPRFAKRVFCYDEISIAQRKLTLQRFSALAFYWWFVSAYIGHLMKCDLLRVFPILALVVLSHAYGAELVRDTHVAKTKLDRFRVEPVLSGYLAYRELDSVTNRSMSETARLTVFAVAFGDRSVPANLSYGMFFEVRQGVYGPARAFVEFDEVRSLDSALASMDSTTKELTGFEDWESESIYRTSTGFSVAKLGGAKDSDIAVTASNDQGRLGMAVRFFEPPSKSTDAVADRNRPVVATFKAKDIKTIRDIVAAGIKVIEEMKSKVSRK